MFTTSSQGRFAYAYSELNKALEDKELKGIRDRVEHLMAHGVNGGRALQDVFTANTIASSRVESRNAALRRLGLRKAMSLCENLFRLRDTVISQDARTASAKLRSGGLKMTQTS